VALAEVPPGTGDDQAICSDRFCGITHARI
jgi:hypothetical protein